MSNEEVQRTVMKAEDEYERLKDKIQDQHEEIEELKIKYNIMKENAETLAKRIDKAIEYIEHNYFITGRIEELHKILKGEDK